MGVYLPNMEMPKSCWACACYHHKVDDGYYDYDVCQASGMVFNDGYASVTGNKTHIDPFKQRLDNCPLIPVPPHGDLIDRDALEKEAQKRLLMCNKNDGQFQKPYEIMRAIALAPTIIPADHIGDATEMVEAEEGE